MRNDHIESEQIYETQHVRLIVIVIMQILNLRKIETPFGPQAHEKWRF